MHFINLCKQVSHDYITKHLITPMLCLRLIFSLLSKPRNNIWMRFIQNIRVGICQAYCLQYVTIFSQHRRTKT